MAWPRTAAPPVSLAASWRCAAAPWHACICKILRWPGRCMIAAGQIRSRVYRPCVPAPGDLGPMLTREQLTDEQWRTVRNTPHHVALAVSVAGGSLFDEMLEREAAMAGIVD